MPCKGYKVLSVLGGCPLSVSLSDHKRCNNFTHLSICLRTSTQANDVSASIRLCQLTYESVLTRGRKKGSLRKGSFHIPPVSQIPLNSLESPGNGRILFCFPNSRGSLEALRSLESLANGHFCKEPFSKRPLSDPD